MNKPKNKDEYRKELADMFIKCLQKDQLNWKKTWQGVDMKSPINAVTKKKYNGINEFSLIMLAMEKGYTDNRWATMVQIIDKKGNYHPKEKWHLKKGSKATYVEYWFPYDLDSHKALTWDEYKLLLKTGRKNDEFSLLSKYTPVFNASCIEGIPEQKKELIHNDVSQDELIGKLSKNMDVEIFHDGGDKAYYSPQTDDIHLPVITSFENDAAYNAVALHELAHSTGHESRLNRNIKNMFGSENYAFEELIAEISSCFMATELKLGDSASLNDNHIAYVQNWVDAIKNDPNVLVKAVKEAQSVANYMDYKAELITEKEYNNSLGHSQEVRSEETKKEKGLEVLKEKQGEAKTVSVKPTQPKKHLEKTKKFER